MAAYRATETGIEIVYGEPGAGKSFFAVQRLIRVMREQRRPVYTNLPLRWRVIKKYLRVLGGERLAGLLQGLTEEHFNRFCARAEECRKFKEQLKIHGTVRPSDQTRAWYKHAGEDVTSGPEANWLPASSVVVIDEAQHWYPNPALKNVRSKVEPEALMSYLSMHRHHMHWVWVLTQRERQISTTIKALCFRQWQVHRRDNDKFAWGLKFKHIGFSALGYRAFRGMDDPEKDEPHETFTVFHWLPQYQVYFRLYDSFTHAGSRRELRRQLREVRKSAGLSEKGELETEVESSMRKRGLIRGFLAGSMKLGCGGVVLLLVLSVGLWAGERRGKRVVEEEAKAKPKEVAASRPSLDRLRGVKVTSVSPTGVVLSGGVRVRLGGEYAGLRLFKFAVEDGRSVWSDGWDVFLWPIGGEPTRVGTVREVATKYGFGSGPVGSASRPDGGAGGSSGGDVRGGLGSDGRAAGVSESAGDTLGDRGS